MENKATPWIKAGIKVFAETGKFEINRIYLEVGKAKSSFYNIYPNFADSKGFDRYVDDVFEHHKRIVYAFFKQMRKAFIIYNFDEAVDCFLEHCKQLHHYHAFSARMRGLQNKSSKIQDYYEALYEDSLRFVHDFWEKYNIHEDFVLDDHDLRLLADSFLIFKEKDFVKDAKTIIYARFKR